MFSYVDYAWEIFTVAEGLPCDIGEAWDRFRADVGAGAAHDYNTAGLLPNFDFAAAGAEWDKLNTAGQQEARNEWYSVMKNDIGAYDRDKVIELVKLYRANDRKGFEEALRK